MIKFPEQKTTDLRVKTWGGGIKDMLSPHVKTYPGIHPPPSQGFTPLHIITWGKRPPYGKKRPASQSQRP